VPLTAALEVHWAALTRHRQDHSLRVANLAAELAELHGDDPDQAWVAGRYHDLAREWARPALLAEARRLGWRVDAHEAAEPVLLHGPVAGLWAEAAGLHPRVVEAITWHTTATPGLGRLGQILFIADGVEPGRGYAEAAALRALAREDLTAGYRAVLLSTARYLASRRLALHPRTEAALQEQGLEWTGPPADG